MNASTAVLAPRSTPSGAYITFGPGEYQPVPSFRRAFTIELSAIPRESPVGWGSATHELNFLLEELGPVLHQALERYYQTRLENWSVGIKRAPTT